ncbi:hypothetical protein CBS101457_002794 [Exobasidium rhododendri]|nr:hypothetical protein CBS101457_002794 [Exobasidium rhododendri]
MLLNGETSQRRKSPATKLPYTSSTAAFNRSPPSSSRGPSERGIEISKRLEGVLGKASDSTPDRSWSGNGSNGTSTSRQKRATLLSPTSQNFRGVEQRAIAPVDDVVMHDQDGESADEALYPGDDLEEDDADDAGEEYGDDYDEDEFTYVNVPAQHFPHLPAQRASKSSRYAENDEVADQIEAAWADDASVTDASDLASTHRYPTYQSRVENVAMPQVQQMRRGQSLQSEKVAVGETFEVAALRRQVEQLQMALKMQMVNEADSHSHGRGSLSSQVPYQTPPTSRVSKRSASNGVRYPFGVPSPEPSRESSTLGSRKKAVPSQQGYQGEQYLGDSHHMDPYHPSQMPSNYHAVEQDYYHNRRPAPQYSPPHMQKLQQQDMEDYRRMLQNHKRVISDPPTMSSILADESASAFVRDGESQRMEELSKKIEALERMFQTSSTISPDHSESSNPTIRTHEMSRNQSNPSFQPSQHATRTQRTPSVSTVSTQAGSYYRARSPASAFHYNPTPYSPDNSLDKGDIHQMQSSGSQDNSSNSSLALPRRKGVARFIMGVGASRESLPRDADGNLVPTMQVSWSRKRNIQIAKPVVTGTKLKVGPGRGRMVIKPTASSPAAT